MPVFKTSITVTVFGNFASAEDAAASLSKWDITHIGREMDEGELCGVEQVGTPTLVAPSALVAELEAIGCDGDFFFDIEDEDVED